MEDCVFKYREPPKVTWCLDYGDDRPSNVIVIAKGLTPVLSVTSERSNILIPDFVEIGGIEDLRKRRLFFDAISIACIHADFQGKRVIALLKKEGSLSSEDQTKIKNICKKFNVRQPNRIGKWPFACVIEVLFSLRIISKDEYNVLNDLRELRNSLQHRIVAKYSIELTKADRILKDAIQVLLRLRELPVGLIAEISGYEYEQFWRDLGYKVPNP